MPHEYDDISQSINPTNNQWIEYRRLIMSELESLNQNLKDMVDKVNSIDKRLAVLESKAAIVGAIAGAVAYAIPKLIEMFMK